MTLTDLTTGEHRATTVTGRPALDAAPCGAASAFAGDRDEGATVTVGAELTYGAGDPRNETLTIPPIFGAGTRFAGSFPAPLAAGWSVTARQARAVDARSPSSARSRGRRRLPGGAAAGAARARGRARAAPGARGRRGAREGPPAARAPSWRSAPRCAARRRPTGPCCTAASPRASRSPSPAW